MEIVSIHERPQHVDTVVRWLWDEWREQSGLTLEQTRERTLRNSGYPATLLAVEGERPLGSLGFGRFNFRGEPPKRLFIDSLYVDAPMRRRGIGGALLEQALGQAARTDPVIHVYTQLPQWYRARGFSVVEAEQGTPNVVLSRLLTPPGRPRE